MSSFGAFFCFERSGCLFLFSDLLLQRNHFELGVTLWVLGSRMVPIVHCLLLNVTTSPFFTFAVPFSDSSPAVLVHNGVPSCAFSCHLVTNSCSMSADFLLEVLLFSFKDLFLLTLCFFDLSSKFIETSVEFFNTTGEVIIPVLVCFFWTSGEISSCTDSGSCTSATRSLPFPFAGSSIVAKLFVLATSSVGRGGWSFVCEPPSISFEGRLTL